jgi:hypothetical protein
MLEKRHIEMYWEEVVRANLHAQTEVDKAQELARQALCGGCTYCMTASRHRTVLCQTVNDLLSIVASLTPGLRSSQLFVKTMNHEFNLYRGFITETGEYVHIHRKMDHSQYRKEHALKYGEESAYRMLNIHGGATKTKVLFCDRKAAPSDAQYETLRDLMIDAEGSLSFHFEFDTRHPQHRCG